MSYLIKLDDACTVFSLYRDDQLLAVETWVGHHLQSIAREHGIDVSMCKSESHMLSILEQYLTIEIE